MNTNDKYILSQRREGAKKGIGFWLYDFASLRENKMMDENLISSIIVDKCLKIHKTLGPGLLESVYEEVLCHELAKHGLKSEKQVGVPLIYEDIKMNLGFRADMIVENRVILELKSVENILPVHKKQLLTYLKITGKKLGLLINFNAELIKYGIIRIVNNL